MPARFRPVAVVVQVIVGEFDTDGDLIAEHARTPERVLKPLGLNVEQLAEKATREVTAERETNAH